jgi:hypothetical protein
MRKRIPCRVIRSVRLGKGGEAPESASRPSVQDSLVADAVTYTHRLTITRTRPDEAAAIQRLDFYV